MPRGGPGQISVGQQAGQECRYGRRQHPGPSQERSTSSPEQEEHSRSQEHDGLLVGRRQSADKRRASQQAKPLGPLIPDNQQVYGYGGQQIVGREHLSYQRPGPKQRREGQYQR